MYKWDEMSKFERDKLVATKVMNLSEEFFNWMSPAGCNYSSDMSDAWKVFQNIKERLFSTRQKFMKELQLLISCNTDLPIGQMLAWPDAFWWITPELICRAALEAVGIEVE